VHVTNGESAAGTLRTTSLDGDVLAWNDALHEGPLAFDADESRPLRARFLAECGWGEEASLLAELERRDATLESASHVALWFEHDLYDQLQLLQILSQLPSRERVELVQADDYLGSLDAAALERLWGTRRGVTDEQLEYARGAWRSVCDGDFDAVSDGPLPYVAPAIRRLAEEREPLPRTKRQLLAALAAGPRTPPELFLASQAQEDAAFLGDTWCFRFLHELAEGGLVTALPAPPPRGDSDAFAATVVDLTPAGRALLAR
jgi:hypothetical protein